MAARLMKPIAKRLGPVALAIGALTLPAGGAAAHDKGGQSVKPSCDSACLEAMMTRYMSALVVRDPSRLPWADKVRSSENNVMLQVGDGLWNVVNHKYPQELIFSDPERGEVGYLGMVDERGTPGFFAMRMKVVDGKIAETESLINPPDLTRPPNPGGGDPKEYRHYPVMSEVLPPEKRTPRRKMIDLAYGYFSTLQLNDGHLFTDFADDCKRLENGFESAGNPKFDRPEGPLSCGEQFKTGTFTFNTAVRDRDFLVIDEARGLVLARGFIDHNAQAASGHLANGTEIKSWIRVPETRTMLELFHITAGKIDRIEAVHLVVPYGMPSVWRRDGE
ncbi:hypothetical protein BH09PSE4_BH09PSE4_23070 [soil metagenome]